MSYKKIKEENGGNKPYACDTCDRAFGLEQELKRHISEHIKCNAGNCDFEAHPKIVALHKRMQHETGYAEAINKLKDAEEIAKWQADRKRRFPTAENILKRKAEQVEKEARGEVIKTKDFGQMKKPRMDNRFNKRHNRNDRRNNRFNRNMHFRNEKLLSGPEGTSNVSLDSDTESDDDSHIKLNKFPGITYLMENPVIQKPEEVVITSSEEIALDNKEQNESDCQEILMPDNEEKDGEEATEMPFDKSIEVIELLQNKEAAVYEINDDSDNEPPTEVPTKKSIETELLEKESAEKKESDIHEIDDDSEVGSPIKMPIVKAPLNEISNSDEFVSKEKPSGKHSMENGIKSNRKFPERKRNRFSNRRNEVVEIPDRKSTLLEKLLADDIRHERNFGFQCIRHIVNNNFFIGED